MQKPGVQGMIKEWRPLDGDVLNGILETVCHDGDEWKIDSSN